MKQREIDLAGGDVIRKHPEASTIFLSNSLGDEENSDPSVANADEPGELSNNPHHIHDPPFSSSVKINNCNAASQVCLKRNFC
ncbi:unnamed protein product [Protopolystoma xenopodis]|uniref:Uncharacterized protein n=1 Tax=Protopolystoma xenopodis TaxID=117903 RepID=A0A3S5BUC6_9PLAT|nr:unnamed protein product [Protopolystoma xenopodis]